MNNVNIFGLALAELLELKEMENIVFHNFYISMNLNYV